MKKKPPPTDKVEFTKEQREKIVEMLLSQERVLSLLYEKTFPAKQEDIVAKNEDSKEVAAGKSSIPEKQ